MIISCKKSLIFSLFCNILSGFATDAPCINILMHEKLLEISDVRTNDDWTLLSGIA